MDTKIWSQLPEELFGHILGFADIDTRIRLKFIRQVDIPPPLQDFKFVPTATKPDYTWGDTTTLKLLLPENKVYLFTRCIGPYSGKLQEEVEVSCGENHEVFKHIWSRRT